MGLSSSGRLSLVQLVGSGFVSFPCVLPGCDLGIDLLLDLSLSVPISLDVPTPLKPVAEAHGRRLGVHRLRLRVSGGLVPSLCAPTHRTVERFSPPPPT